MAHAASMMHQSPARRTGGRKQERSPLGKGRKQLRDAPDDQSPNSRAAILSAALQAFARYGYDGASLPKIARIAGVAGPLIHYYFGSKEQLWRETVDFSLGSLVREADTIVGATRSLQPLDRLRALLEAFASFAAHFPDHFSMILAEARSDSDRFPWVNENYTLKLFGYVTANLREAREAGAIRDVVIDDLAIMMVGAIFTKFAAGPNEQDESGVVIIAGKYVEEIFDIFLNGVVKVRGSSADNKA